MSVIRVRAIRSAGFVSALLLSTALAAPAFAQIEEVVVTAQKKSEDVMTVPIAMSAYSSQDLKAHQVVQFKDLQFSTPSVSYTKGNFTGSDFQIRGIGVTAVGYDAESGVAINYNDVYLATPNIADAAFYDLERIEVLRGPQSTLYGRGATGGVVNVVAAKPVLDTFASHLEATYGNYNHREVKGMVNIPIVTDQLGLRIAGDWVKHSGFTTNLFNNSHPDDRSQYSVRASMRWQPSANTTVDFTGSFSNEDDHKMRSQKQLCHSDPSGILGCLPDTLAGTGVVNTNSTLATIASSNEGMASAFGVGLGSALGLSTLTAAPTLPAGFTNPTDVRKINTSFNPTYRAQDNFLSLEWKQSWTDWLNSTAVFGYDNTSVYSQESYNNVPGSVIDPTKLAVASATFLGTMSALGGPAYAANFAPFFAMPGKLPLSGTTNLGITGGNYTYTNELAAYDQSNGRSKQWSGEVRFNTSFDGPINGMIAAYYLRQKSSGDYFVNAPTLDYPGIILGGFLGLTQRPADCIATGCIDAPSYYRNQGDYNSLTSKAVYGELYYDAIPNTLKFTLGARWTIDKKFQRGRILLYSGVVPIGTTDQRTAMADLATLGLRDFDCSNGSTGAIAAGHCATTAQPLGPNDVWQLNSVTYRKWTGRFVADWTPKLDFTNYTLLYASYARGYKAGGFNPGIQPGLGVPASYGPEQIDAYEIGTKNTLLGGTLQANGDIWYYNYKGLQVSKIENNTSVNENIDATLWGVEGTFVWQPTERLQFNLNLSNTNSQIGNSSSIDPRNPSNSYNKALLIKDATLGNTVGENCVIYYNGATPGSLPAGFGFFPGVGGVGALSSVGIPYSAYGTCLDPNTVVGAVGGVPVTYGQALAAQGFSTTDPSVHGTYGGVPKSLKGNQLQNTPDFTISVGAQYTQPLAGDYNLVGRVDYYWQTDMFGRIFNGPADKIPSWDVMNLQLTLNAPDNLWYARAFVKNVMDNDNLTGMYLTSPTSGLYTNGFYGNPRTYGVALGVNF